MGGVLSAALGYAARGWPVFPVARNKRPISEHGRSDATRDEAIIRDWFTARPDALVAIATGEESGIVALDVDVDQGAYGPDSLEALGVTLHPATPTAHTPTGGFHMLFRHPGPGVYVKTIAGKLGRGLDIRGDGGSLTLPPGPGRSWDPHLGLDTPLAAMPDWMIIPEPPPERPVAQETARPVGELSRYCEAALDGAYRRIIEAPAGQQEETLNRENFALATLVGAWGMPPKLALDALHNAAGKMPSHDRRRPWRQKELERKVSDAFTAGLRNPRERRHG
jgi:hypothetical protein